MGEKSKIVLKTKFEAGQIPTEDDFGDVLDSSINKVDDQVSVRNIGRGPTAARYLGVGSVDPESPLSVRNRGKKQNLVGFEDADGNEKWQIQIDPENGEEGLNLVAKDAESANLFIQSEGKVGIGNKRPEERLHVEGKVKAEQFIGKIDWNNLSNAPSEYLVPKGGIIMWSGNESDIPDGWKLCDGSKNTPDLRGRFILSSGEAADLSERPIGEIGGDENILLTPNNLPSHSHGLSDNNVGFTENDGGWLDYQNMVKSLSASSGGLTVYYNDIYDGDEDRSNHRSTGSTSSAVTSLSRSSVYTRIRYKSGAKTDETGGNVPIENMPPFYVLAFIMKS